MGCQSNFIVGENPKSSIRGMSQVTSLDQFQCCGYDNISDPPYPYTNSTDPNACKFQQPCRSQIQGVVSKSLLPLGISGIILGSIELTALILCLIYIRMSRKRKGILKEDMDAAWRVNQDKIKLGYSKFDVRLPLCILTSSLVCLIRTRSQSCSNNP